MEADHPGNGVLIARLSTGRRQPRLAQVRTDWEAWNARTLHDEDIVRLILDGTVVRAKFDRKATATSLLVAIGVRRDDQKILLALKK